MEPRAQDSGSGLLLLYQIQTVHSCNEYTESPMTRPHPQISDSTPDEGAVPGPDDHIQDSSHLPQCALLSTGTGPSSEQGTVEHKGETVVKELPEKFEQEVRKGLCAVSNEDLSFLGNLGKKVTVVEEQPGNFESKQEVLELGGRFISERRSLGSVGKLDAAIQEQPKSCDSKQDEMKLLGSASTYQKHLKLEPKHEPTKQHNRKHPRPCDRCSRCMCRDCTAATPLPGCGQCSAEELVECTTCVCCLKALLYHCSSDDEDRSADAPFSCRKSRRCTRWSMAAAMAFVLPCLLCYGPARGCLAVCQLCYDHTHRTGCRCKRQHVTDKL